MVVISFFRARVASRLYINFLLNESNAGDFSLQKHKKGSAYLYGMNDTLRLFDSGNIFGAYCSVLIMQRAQYQSFEALSPLSQYKQATVYLEVGLAAFYACAAECVL